MKLCTIVFPKGTKEYTFKIPMTLYFQKQEDVRKAYEMLKDELN